jgi:hypothetical protein
MENVEPLAIVGGALGGMAPALAYAAYQTWRIWLIDRELARRDAMDRLFGRT